MSHGPSAFLARNADGPWDTSALPTRTPKVDTSAFLAPRWPLMSAFRQLLTLALLATWWLATMHCRVEASIGSGVFACENDSREADTASDEHACDDDVCHIVEDGNYRNAVANVHVAPPALSPDDGLAKAIAQIMSVHALANPQPAFAAAAFFERPRDWVPGWSFVRRAAPLSRAPSALIA